MFKAKSRRVGLTVTPVTATLPPPPLAVIVIDNCFASVPLLLVALTVKVDGPAVVGVPEIVPVDALRLKPAGNEPLLTLHVMGVSPAAESVWLYAVPTVPLGNDVVMIVGAVPPPVLPLGSVVAEAVFDLALSVPSGKIADTWKKTVVFGCRS